MIQFQNVYDFLKAQEDLSNGVLKSKIFVGAIIYHFSALDHGIWMKLANSVISQV